MRILTVPKLEAQDPETGELNVIVETPRGSANKYTYKPELDVFELSKTLPCGYAFPHDFGFIPATLGEDGDPLDVLVLMEEPAYPGVLVKARLIGAIEARQTEDGKTTRNDRLIAVSSVSKAYADVNKLNDLYETAVSAIEDFFISYNEAAGKTFKVTGHADSEDALRLVKSGCERFKQGPQGEKDND